MKTVNTINDIAKLAGVSKSTVSRALNNSSLISLKTRQKIQAIALQHNFILHKGAQNLSLQKSRTLTFVSPLGTDKDHSINDPYLIELLKAVIEATTQHGYDLLIGRPQSDSPEDIFNYIHSNQSDGVILVGCGIDLSTKEAVGQVGTITIGSDSPENMSCVDCDNHTGGMLAANHLLDNGCNRIAFLGGVADGGETRLRLQGYKDAMSKANVDIDTSLVSFEDYSSKAGYDRMSEWLREKRDIDGLFACSDLMAIGAIEAMREYGLVAGRDIGVVGFDDIPLAKYCSPPLTTIRQDIHSIGMLLVDNLLKNIKDKEISKTIVPVELVVRKSSISNIK